MSVSASRRSSVLSLLVGVGAVTVLSFGCHRKGASSPESPVASAATEAPPAGGNLIKNSHFETAASIPWMTSFTAPASGGAKVEDGALCITIDNVGTQPWDAQLRHREMVAEQNHTYTTSFRIWANQPGRARLKLGKSGPPYNEYWFQDIALSETPRPVRATFTMRGPTDPTVEFAFHLGGRLAQNAKLPLKVCIDDVYLSDPEYVAPSADAASTRSRVRVNQVGYFLHGKKVATWASESSEPTPWVLKNQQGEEVARGTTTSLGFDASSGDHVHEVDFSSVVAAGAHYVLEVGGDQSAPFAIAASLYGDLIRDALSYFYHNRSGVPIELPYAGDSRWVRPAGHAQSDKSVPCGTGTGCNYQLDVSGGWYDAGDQGKYVVNGGIAVWTLLSTYERALAKGQAAALGDGTLNLPEKANGVPDLLDEVRYELEFLLKMQVPPGLPHAGMAHHKIHDVEWTALGVRPDQAEKAVKRALRPVSTAATLNLAAVAAQAARLYDKVDPAFAQRCKEAAERALAAADKEPALYAKAEDQTGGGPYQDDDVSDEFFWALTELWLTTGDAKLYERLSKSPHFPSANRPRQAPAHSSMAWQRTGLLGKISWMYAPRGASQAAAKKLLEAELLELAEEYLATAEKEGYRVPHGPDAADKYYWGSNSDVLNNAVVLGVAYDLSKKDAFLTAAAWGMDYLLGRNALGQSYVSGYGSAPLEHPHHRFWAQQADAQFPPPPPGVVSGGPNSELQDPYAQAAGLPGCAPQKCFVDHIEAYSLNEIAINWNAPLVWLLFFLEHPGAAK